MYMKKKDTVWYPVTSEATAPITTRIAQELRGGANTLSKTVGFVYSSEESPQTIQEKFS